MYQFDYEKLCQGFLFLLGIGLDTIFFYIDKLFLKSIYI